MPPFKEDQILIIAPGSQTTLAQLGIPESLTPATHHIRSCMFAAEKDGEYEPRKIRRKAQKPVTNGDGQTSSTDGTVSAVQTAKSLDALYEYEEDPLSETDAIWPIVAGQVIDWPCFYALMTHVFTTINPPFHTPVLLIAEPVWTPRDHEKITQFFFEKFKIPAFVILDAAMATSYAYRLPHATIVDVGLEKADITAINDHLIHITGRTLALADCGGDSMTQTLLQRLSGSKFSRDMCEQLKKSPICEILAPTDEVSTKAKDNPAAAASTGANGPIGSTAAALDASDAEPALEEDNEGVLDIASIVTSGNMTEFLEQKEREKQEKATAKAQRKAGDATATTAAKPVKLANSKRPRSTFTFHDYALETALRDMNVDNKGMADMQNAMNVDSAGSASGQGSVGAANADRMAREIEVGAERFQAASGGILERLGDAIHRTISAVEEVPRRSDLWNSIVVVGNGSKIKGFKEALVAHLQAKYLISPSSATMFTSEIPSNMSTPIATGMNTPLPQHATPTSMQPPHGNTGSQVNPMLLAATAGAGGQNAYSAGISPAMSAAMVPGLHASTHSQTPTNIDMAKMPEYFPEWKDVGYEEAVFLGAQVAVKVIFSGGDSGGNKAYMTRSDYNEQGPQAIHDFSV